MKFQVQALLAAGLAATANAHAIFQKLSINGVEQAQLAGFRAPRSNDPIMDVQSNDIICQAPGSTSSNVVNIPAGAKVGTYWGHVIGGEQYPGDVDHPIAASHKGPIAVYLAKVNNAATTEKTGLKWFKVAHEGLNGGKWAVDNLISNKGWWYFNLPTCLAPGNYLLRAELIALHSAYDNLGAQFYISCVQINVTGGGSFIPSSTVSFPGAYPQDHPGIKLSVYGGSGQPDNGGKAYSIPGPAPVTCPAGGSNPPPAVTTTRAPVPTTTRAAATTSVRPAVTTTLVTSRRPAATTTRAAAQTTKTTGSACQPTGPAQPKQTLYGQCGGVYYTGPTVCAQGSCKVSNPYYSQCLN